MANNQSQGIADFSIIEFAKRLTSSDKMKSKNNSHREDIVVKEQHVIAGSTSKHAPIVYFTCIA